ncbi:protein O-glucosyltransferase 3 isoform X3 [Odocoileus virginianus]|uniref:Protein O-glucosyltransferase 3 isoform X3 n=1 Tax=Odocoileus virginianus TaxID=9874 RepID=A0ABM4IPI8_ODOVR
MRRARPRLPAGWEPGAEPPAAEPSPSRVGPGSGPPYARARPSSPPPPSWGAVARRPCAVSRWPGCWRCRSPCSWPQGPRRRRSARRGAWCGAPGCRRASFCRSAISTCRPSTRRAKTSPARPQVLLPDLEFYVNLGDWPLEHRKVNETPGPLPIISWCGSLDSRDVILPTYDITHSTLEALRGVTNDLLSIQGNTGPSWINKTEKAFFRGRDSREERLQLVQLSKENPQLLDAGITGYFFFQEKEKELGKAKLIGFFDFFKYKYQVNVDGTVAAYRYPYLMLGDSLVLKQDSPYYEHFYMALKPWKHYIPIKRNLSDLLEKVEWAKENDEEAEKIAKEGQVTARDLLQPHRLYCYYYRVLQKYAERQLSKPEIRDGMELVPQPDDSASLCQCHRKRPLRQEL